ncbi:DNA polymerase III subunit gamma/tau [Candidatus Sumerlaeota bacterium]|nr:DNA polymerase III subunit gamma/tau [Candidatus Sumerlaeota bacterium]
MPDEPQIAENRPTSYIGLARRYRPGQFSELVGQDQIAHSLAQQVLQGRVAQAYIFSGPRGIGKTSTARILAKSLNCAEGPTPTPCGKCDHCVGIARSISMDVIEIDGASNRGIDDIRDLQETISQNPFAARKKVYIIDEVHMLTREAFNALLKTLEEPPPFVVFIFATTEFEKIPETIKSRCQAFQFTRISIEDLVRRLRYVAEKEKIELDAGEEQAIFETIALAVDGGLRDALMALDQLAALGGGAVRLDETVRFLGVVEHDLLIRTVEMLVHRDTKGLLEMVSDLVDRGRDLERFVKNLLSFLRDLMILKAGGGRELVNLTGDKLARAEALLWGKGEGGERTDLLSYPTLLNYVQIFMGLEARMKEAVQVRVHLEFAFVKLTAIEPVVDIAHLLKNFDRYAGGTGGARRVDSAAAPAAIAPPTAPQPKPGPSTPDLFGGGVRREAAQAGGQGPLDLGSRDGATVWTALLAQKDRLGIGIFIALNNCRFLGLDGGRLTVGLEKRSLHRSTLEDPSKTARIEEILKDLTGQAVSFSIRTSEDSPARAKTAPEQPRPAAARVPEPVLRAPAPAESWDPDADLPVDEYAGEAGEYSGEMDTRALYMAQNPTARTRETLKTDEALRRKVDMVKRFFDGKLLDATGREIVLDA